MQISKGFQILGFHFQAGNPKDKKIKFDLFQVIQQAADRELPDSQACDIDSRLVTLRMQWCELPNTAHHLCLQHWRAF